MIQACNGFCGRMSVLTREIQRGRWNGGNMKLAKTMTRDLSTTPLFISSDVLPIHNEFLANIAKAPILPARLGALLEILQLKGDTLLHPIDNRKGVNPFLIPISKAQDNSVLSFIRWPTQKEDMELQLVRQSDPEAGVTLVSLNTDNYIKKIVAELDFEDHSSFTTALNTMVNSGLKYDKQVLESLMKSGKFPVATNWDKKLVLDRYLLTKVGSFPDCYERLATNYLKQGQEVTALITCERSCAVFYGWGHPQTFHATMLNGISGRQRETTEVAKTAMVSPKWTLANTKDEVNEIIKMAGYSDAKVVGDMHVIRSKDARTKDIEEGVDPKQILLDQAAHIMDAAALGSIPGGWDAIREEVAMKYEDGGYPHIKDFILAY